MERDGRGRLNWRREMRKNVAFLVHGGGHFAGVQTPRLRKRRGASAGRVKPRPFGKPKPKAAPRGVSAPDRILHLPILGCAGVDGRPSRVLPMKIALQYREQASRVYYRAVFEAKKEIPDKT